jgi:hypothetical protein
VRLFADRIPVRDRQLVAGPRYIGVGVSVVEWQEEMAWDEVSDACSDFNDSPARADLDPVTVPDLQAPGILGPDFHKGLRSRLAECGNPAGLGARVPVVDNAPGLNQNG